MPLDVVDKSILTLTETDRERFLRYQRAWAYYRAQEYLGDEGEQYLRERKLFKHLRRVFGYVTQTVDTDARFLMRKRLGVEADPEFQEDIYALWERSNFQSQKYKLARYGSLLGDAFLILRDVGDGATVVPQLVVANSEDMTIRRDPDDQDVILWARQSYTFRGEDGRPHRRDWVYTAEEVYRFTDTEDFRRPDQGWPKRHPFGEVPVIHIRNIDLGEEYGASSWHHVQGQLDEINELASYTNRILLRYADPALIARGVRPHNQPVIRRGIHEDNVYYLSDPQADMHYLEYEGNVLSQLIDQVKLIEANIRDQLPELALSDLRDQASLSGYAVSLKLADLIAKIDEMRGNYGNALEWANALALRAIRRSKAPLEEFAHRVVFEPVLPPDELQKLQTWQLEQDIGIVSKQELLRRQGLTDKEIQDRLDEIRREAGELFGLPLGTGENA